MPPGRPTRRSEPGHRREEVFRDLRDLLVEHARCGRTLAYSETGLTRNVIGPQLDELNRAEHDLGHPLLSVLVVHKEGRMPGEGFFQCAKELGRYDGKKDRAEFVRSEQLAVFSFWKGSRG